MHGVGAGVAGFRGELLGLDRADHFGLARVGLGVEYVGARGADARQHQVAALERPLVALVAKRAGTGVPPEVMELIAPGRQVRPTHHLAVAGRVGVAVDHGHRVALLARGVEGRHVGELLGRGGDRGGGRAVEGGVRSLGHLGLLPENVDEIRLYTRPWGFLA